MKGIKVIMVLACFCMAMQPIRGQQFRIMSYNIHHGKDREGTMTLDSMGDFIAKMGVDVVTLQEVDSVCERSNHIDQPARLGNLTGMNEYFTRHFAFQGGAYGQALLTNWQVTNPQNFRLPVFPLDQGREVSVLLTEVEIEKGKAFALGILHLDYRSTDSRLYQIELLLDSLLILDNLVLAGDFNALPDSPEMQKLFTHFDRHTTDPERYTFPARDADRKIDYILVSKSANLRIVDEQVPDVTFSDHLPVITTLEWTNTGGAE